MRQRTCGDPRSSYIIHWSVNRDRSKQEVVRVWYRRRKKVKDSLKSSGCSLIVSIACTVRRSRKRLYKGDGKCGIDTQND